MTSKLEARSSQLLFVFFGTGEIAVGALNELENANLLPALIVTAPDKPQGRKLVLTPPPAKMWATEHGIEILQPEKLDAEFISSLEPRTSHLEANLFVVVDYGKFLPKALLELPEHGVINMHPSLLPRLRGPSPIRSAILQDEKTTGVSIMKVDAKMDHGPIIAQRKVDVSGWHGSPERSGGGPPRGRDLDALLAREGGKLLAEIMPHWVGGDIEPQEQNHDVATYSSMVKKEDGLLDLQNGDPYQNLLKIRAFDGWPGTYAFFDKNGKQIRAKILDAHLENGTLVIDTVKPEGKKDIPFSDFTKQGWVAA